MKITEKTLVTLEFDKIRQMLAESCPTSGAARLAASLMPIEHADLVRRRLRRTTDARRLSDAKGMPSFGSVVDVGDICERAQKGAVLTPRELLDAATVLSASRLLLDYIRSNRLFETVLDEVFERLLPNRRLEERIKRSILSEDMIADEASPALADVRRKIRAANIRIKDTLAKYVSGGYSKYLQENIVTQRNGRYVIPVKAECRNDVKGLIHDTSSSGATVFVEPMAVVDANNELRMLEAKEAHEIEKILADLSGEISDIAPTLSLNYRNITELCSLDTKIEKRTEKVTVCQLVCKLWRDGLDFDAPNREGLGISKLLFVTEAEHYPLCAISTAKGVVFHPRTKLSLYLGEERLLCKSEEVCELKIRTVLRATCKLGKPLF